MSSIMAMCRSWRRPKSTFHYPVSGGCRRESLAFAKIMIQASLTEMASGRSMYVYRGRARVSATEAIALAADLHRVRWVVAYAAQLGIGFCGRHAGHVLSRSLCFLIDWGTHLSTYPFHLGSVVFAAVFWWRGTRCPDQVIVPC